MNGKFWYSERQATILREMGQDLNLCSVFLCAEKTTCEYTEMIEPGHSAYGEFEPLSVNEALFLGEGEVIEVRCHFEGGLDDLLKLKGII
jgi:hypothetical protein